MTTTDPDVPVLAARAVRGYGARTPDERRRIDEGALRDAIAALDSRYWQDEPDRSNLLAQIDAIRLRLPDHGASVEEHLQNTHRFVPAAPDPRDPPDTLRYVVVHPDGTRTPRHARTVEDQERGE